MNIHFIQHESFEPPGAYLKWAKQRGHHIAISKVFEHQALPDDVSNIDFLIVMGGPQSPDTTTEEYSYFDAKAEMKLMKDCIDAGKLVVGVCLGAQLMGQALGANYERSPEREIGNFPIQLTAEGQKDDNLSHLGHSFVTGHWHNDMPGLTADSVVLAVSEGCPRQIIKYADRAYGIQCHLEFSSEIAGLLIEQDSNLEAKNKIYKYFQSPDQLLNYNYSEMNEKLYSFLDKLAAAKN